jgi:hypothetical protein
VSVKRAVVTEEMFLTRVLVEPLDTEKSEADYWQNVQQRCTESSDPKGHSESHTRSIA